MAISAMTSTPTSPWRRSRATDHVGGPARAAPVAPRRRPRSRRPPRTPPAADLRTWAGQRREHPPCGSRGPRGGGRHARGEGTGSRGAPASARGRPSRPSPGRCASPCAARRSGPRCSVRARPGVEDRDWPRSRRGSPAPGGVLELRHHLPPKARPRWRSATSMFCISAMSRRTGARRRERRLGPLVGDDARRRASWRP